MRGLGPRGATVVRWSAVVAWMALIFLLSAQPGLRISQDPAVDAPARALAHMTVFAILGALFTNALGPTGRSPGRTAGLALLLAALYSVSDEAHQAFVPDRTARVQDVLLDVAGAAVGVAVMSVLARRRSRGARLPSP